MRRAWWRRGCIAEKEKNLVICNFRISCASSHSCLTDINPQPCLLAFPTTCLSGFSQLTLLFTQTKLLSISFLLFSLSCQHFSTLSLTYNLPEYPVVSPASTTVWQNRLWESMGVTGHNWLMGAKSFFRVPPAALWNHKVPLWPSSFTPWPFPLYSLCAVMFALNRVAYNHTLLKEQMCIFCALGPTNHHK